MPIKQTFKNVKFIHCRYRNKDGSIAPRGGLTIAYVVNENFKVVGYAASKCNKLDAYRKQLGRQKAAGRLLSEAHYNEASEIDEPVFIEQAHEGFKREF